MENPVKVHPTGGGDNDMEKKITPKAPAAAASEKEDKSEASVRVRNRKFLRWLTQYVETTRNENA